MQYDNVESFAKLLQLSISPVVLISAVGLLLLSLNNRLARIIDRTRELANDIQSSGEKNLEELQFELKVMFNRSHILRAAVTLVSTSIFFASLVILVMFFIFFIKLPASAVMLKNVVLMLFMLSIVSLVGCMIFFLVDVFKSLKVLNLDVKKYLSSPKES